MFSDSNKNKHGSWAANVAVANRESRPSRRRSEQSVTRITLPSTRIKVHHPSRWVATSLGQQADEVVLLGEVEKGEGSSRHCPVSQRL